MSSKEPSRTKNAQRRSKASSKGKSGNSEPHPTQQVSGPVSPAEVGLRDREQMESVNGNTDFKLKAGNNKNLNKAAPQKVGKMSIGNFIAASESVFRGRRVELDLVNNENHGIIQEVDDCELFTVYEPPTCPCNRES